MNTPRPLALSALCVALGTVGVMAWPISAAENGQVHKSTPTVRFGVVDNGHVYLYSEFAGRVWGPRWHHWLRANRKTLTVGKLVAFPWDKNQWPDSYRNETFDLYGRLGYLGRFKSDRDHLYPYVSAMGGMDSPTFRLEKIQAGDSVLPATRNYVVALQYPDAPPRKACQTIQVRGVAEKTRERVSLILDKRYAVNIDRANKMTHHDFYRKEIIVKWLRKRFGDDLSVMKKKVAFEVLSGDFLPSSGADIFVNAKWDFPEYEGMGLVMTFLLTKDGREVELLPTEFTGGDGKIRKRSLAAVLQCQGQSAPILILNSILYESRQLRALAPQGEGFQVVAESDHLGVYTDY